VLAMASTVRTAASRKRPILVFILFIDSPFRGSQPTQAQQPPYFGVAPWHQPKP
jgi:hypothetical protein